MPAVTIRNLSEATHRALKVRAAQHGRSAEAEMRDILETAVRPATRLPSATSSHRWSTSAADSDCCSPVSVSVAAVLSVVVSPRTRVMRSAPRSTLRLTTPAPHCVSPDRYSPWH